MKYTYTLKIMLNLLYKNPEKIPFHLCKQTENKLKELEESDIIEFVPSGTPTPFVSNLVVAPKPNNPASQSMYRHATYEPNVRARTSCYP